MGEDLRIIKTKRSIAAAFLELRSKKELERITVKELCERAAVNKSTFYTHYQDLYDLADQLETQVAADIVAGMCHPETVFSDPGAFNRELVREYVAREELIHLLFSGSRASLLPGKIEQSLKELIFSLRPDLKDNAAANVFFTIEIYGGFYAFEKCRAFGVDAVVEIMTVLNEKIAELLR